MLGLGRVIAINDPVLLEHILKTNFENYEKGYILNSTLAQVLGNGTCALLDVVFADLPRSHKKKKVTSQTIDSHAAFENFAFL